MSTIDRPTTQPRQVDLAVHAVFVIFGSAGFIFASWASRIPQLRDALDLGPGPLGLVLFTSGVGAVLAIPTAGIVVGRFGARRAIVVTGVLAACGLVTIAVGQTVGVAPVVVGLFALGVGSGIWDVAMNVEGAAVEQRLGRSIMSRFHAGFSVGTVAGALLGAAMQAVGMPVLWHLVGVACLVLGVLLASVRGLPDVQLPLQHSAGAERPRHPLRAWTEPRTLAIGVFVLALAFTEGAGNDWLAVAVIDGYDVPAVAGTLTFAVFLSMMTLGRWCGTGILDRHGRVVVLRAGTITALAGVAVVVLGDGLALAILGAALWGLGTSLGFPVGMSAASDDPTHAAARVSVVSAIGYVAFLAGPPLIGLLGDRVGVLHSLVVVAAMLALGTLAVGATRPVTTSEETR